MTKKTFPSRSSLGPAATNNDENSGDIFHYEHRFRLDVIKHARFMQPIVSACTCILRVAFLVISTGSGECMTSHAHVRAFTLSRKGRTKGDLSHILRGGSPEVATESVICFV
jgi:hypothetical protein